MNCIILTFILLIYSFNAAKIIDNIEYIDQTEDYPTGCDSISTIMCLHYWKINILFILYLFYHSLLLEFFGTKATAIEYCSACLFSIKFLS